MCRRFVSPQVHRVLRLIAFISELGYWDQLRYFTPVIVQSAYS